MGSAQVHSISHGRLGITAGFNGDDPRWLEDTRARLERLYETNPFRILKAGAPLKDYAAYWLLQKADGKSQRSLEQQQDLWSKVFKAAQPHELVKVHLNLGWDVTAPRLGEVGNTVLMELASCRTAFNDLGHFLLRIPVEGRAAHINERNRQGVAALHHVAVHRGSLSVVETLVAQGGNSGMAVPVPIAGGYVAQGNLAHVAVVAGNHRLVAGLTKIAPHLFAEGKYEHTPHELGQMHLETMLENYGRKQFGHLLLGAFAALASRGNLQTEAQDKNKVIAEASLYNRTARAVNLAAQAAGQPMPYMQHAPAMGRR